MGVTQLRTPDEICQQAGAVGRCLKAGGGERGRPLITVRLGSCTLDVAREKMPLQNAERRKTEKETYLSTCIN